MTDELQPVETETAINTEITIDGGAELAPATGDNQPNDDSDLLQKESVKKAIHKQHAKYRDEERKRLAAEQEAQKLKERLEALETEKGEITIPAMPDPYADDYEAQIQAREDAIRRQAAQDAQKQSMQAQQTAQQEAAQQAEQERIQGLMGDYNQRVAKSGLDANEIAQAGQTVISYGISDEIAEFLLQDEDGPLMVKHLAANPVVLDEIRFMNPIHAAIKLNTEIRQAASTLKPQAPGAPDPVEPLSGRGAGEKVSQFTKGATFE